MKKVSLFWCLGNLEAISFFSLFLTFTVQPPSVSRQRCHMNIRSGHCYLMKEGRTGEEGVGSEVRNRMGRWGGGRVAVVIKARYHKQRQKGNGSRQLTAQLRWWRQSEACYDCLIRSEEKRRKGTQKNKKTNQKQKLPKWRDSNSRSRDSLPPFHHDSPATASGSHLILFTCPPPLPPRHHHCGVLLKAKWKIKEEIQHSSSAQEKEKSFFFCVINICSVIHIFGESLRRKWLNLKEKGYNTMEKHKLHFFKLVKKIKGNFHKLKIALKN